MIWDISPTPRRPPCYTMPDNAGATNLRERPFLLPPREVTTVVAALFASRGVGGNMRKSIAFAVLLLLFSLTVRPALAVWGGEPDNGRHPMVRAMYADFDGSGGITWDELLCSGSYAGPSRNAGFDVFLTAGHCVAPLEGFGITEVFVSFDEDPKEGDGIPEGLIAAVDSAWDPRFGHDLGNLYDSAVLLLPPGSVTGITPVQLPPAGYLDDLKRAGELQHMTIELVGYGVVPVWQQPGGTQFIFDGLRRTSYSQVTGLSPAWLRLLQNTKATGLGGQCFGDSGSPQFIPGTTTIVSTTTGGNGNCNANNYNYRLDTPGAREFLGQFLQLP